MHASLPHGNFQEGYIAMFIAPRRVLKGARRLLYPSKQPGENSDMGHSACLHDSILSTMGYPPLCVL